MIVGIDPGLSGALTFSKNAMSFVDVEKPGLGAPGIHLRLCPYIGYLLDTRASDMPMSLI